MDKERSVPLEYETPMKKKGGRRFPISLWLLGIQVIVALLWVSHRGAPKRLWMDTLELLGENMPAILSVSMAILELRPKNRGRQDHVVLSIIALTVSGLIVVINAYDWYRLIWRDRHGVW